MIDVLLSANLKHYLQLVRFFITVDILQEGERESSKVQAVLAMAKAC